MKKTVTKKTLIHSAVALFTFNLSLAANAQSSYEVMCRNKAKEIAALTYSSCMTEERQTQINQIRTEYKDQLTLLKEEYNQRLKKITDERNAEQQESDKNNDSAKGSATEKNDFANSEAGAHESSTTNTNLDKEKNQTQAQSEHTQRESIQRETAQPETSQYDTALPESMHSEIDSLADTRKSENVENEATEAVIVDTTDSNNHSQESVETVVTIAPMADQDISPSAKKPEMTVSLKQIKKTVPADKNKISAKKPAKLATGANNTNKKTAVKKTTQNKKISRALPAKKIKSQSIDLNTPSEIQNQKTAAKKGGTGSTELVDVRGQ